MYFPEGLENTPFNMFVTSKNETTNLSILQFTNSAAKRPESLLKTLFNGELFLILEKKFKPCFFILKALKDTLQDFKFMNWCFVLQDIRIF